MHTPSFISVRGAREHNLRSIDVDIPRGALTVVTGVSGSGKSSLAFDTICAEGRRRYLETYSSYARQFLGSLSTPAADRIEGLSPAVALDQAGSVRQARSTVGTMSELYDLLRLLWARFGAAPPPAPGEHQPPLARQLFSFNSPHGACPACKGLGVEDRLDPDLLVADSARTVRGGALRITTPTGYLIYSQVTIDVLDQVCRAHGFSVDIPWRDLTLEQRDVILNGSDRIRIPYGKHPLESRMRWTGITARPREEGVYKGILPVMEQILRQKRNANILRFVRSLTCRACAGRRLRPEALAVTYRGLSIADAAALSIDDLRAFVDADPTPDDRAAPILAFLRDRCALLQTLGLGYLSSDRESTSLAAGEAQRIRLARQAAIGLTGVLFVFDEPSVGLHPRDTARLLDVLRGIRDRGNTVVVVEHDEDTIASADWIVDVGPGAGDAGGRLLYSGPAQAFLRDDVLEAWPAAGSSRTRAFLRGDERLPVPARRRPGTGTLTVSDVTARNLRDVTAGFLLGAANVVTGVSGAGKSTLLDATRRLVEDPASGGGRLASSTPIDKVIDIDQTPIGRTPRSNPATYTGAFDHIRDLFAGLPESQREGFGKGRFSFNVPGGRCEACEGAGVRQIGMQFLGTVAVVCDACGGRRFNEATLAVRLRDRSIADVLRMPVSEACGFFADHPPLARILGALRDLGLGYLPLGHPATMLSGGEAQRVKLASELARPAARHTLYLLDEPTTGLHAADIAHLLEAFERLVSTGHTVIAIEHHLAVIGAADRVVDLGPGSGRHGGRVVATGTPEEVAASPESETGRALASWLRAQKPTGVEARERRGKPDATTTDSSQVNPNLVLTNVSTHNLQHVDVEIPHGSLTVITGVSGSGKSSLAFDTIFAEGQQRFAESFSAYARRFVQRADEAEFDAVSGLTPTVAVSQSAPSRNPRSTVATVTEIHDTYRLLFSRAGIRHCPQCGAVLAEALCGACGFAGAPVLTASMFSPNSEAGACPACHGLGHSLECNPDALITDPSKPIAGGAMAGHKPGRFYGDPRGQHMATLGAAAQALGLDVGPPWNELTPEARDLALRGAGERVFDVEWRYQRGARLGTHTFTSPWAGLLALVRQEYDRKHHDARGEALAFLMEPVACRACGGARLAPEALAVRFGGLNISELLALSVDDSLSFFDAAASGPDTLPAAARAVSAPMRDDAVGRLGRLRDAGLGYLTLDRPASTLSGGEAQRVRLAALLRSGLTGVTYVLDEPTAGLHPRDTSRLLGLLRGLRDAGNTLIVVEHDLDVIAAADHVIDIGPGAGPDGGRIVAQGSPDAIRSSPSSVTGPYLQSRARRRRDEIPRSSEPGLRPGLSVRGARVHNLDGLDVDIPAGGLVVIAGVSGSGKSSLIFDVLAPSLERLVATGADGHAPVHCDTVTAHVPLRAVVTVDSARSVAASPWSMVATQAGVFDAVRQVFAASPGARERNLTKAAFSLSTPGGRCDACEGIGRTRVSMDFLPDVWTICDDCAGRRFGAAVLACQIGGRSLADVLEMSVNEAAGYFEGLDGVGRAQRTVIREGLGALRTVGLGYIRLGQAARTLSGGERQRVLLASALTAPAAGPTLYLFDEPTTGLHMQDVERLMAVFDRLVEAGHLVVAVEHHLAVIAGADWVVDLGPEGGAGGGRLVAAGPPAVIAANESSWTGRALRDSGLTVPGACS